MKEKNSVNQGIQADTVHADVLAVGANARAKKQIIARPGIEEMQNAIAELTKAITELNLNETAYSVVKEDIDKLKDEGKKDEADKGAIGGTLKSIADKLKMVGITVSEVNSLANPMKNIAMLVKSTLDFL